MFTLDVTESREVLVKQLQHSAKNKRIPLVLSSKQFYTDLNHLVSSLRVSSIHYIVLTSSRLVGNTSTSST